MKYDLSKIMKRAWIIKKMNKRNLFGPSLKLSWYEFKKMLKDKIVNEMLNTFCAQKRPNWYRNEMSTNGILKILEKNNIEIPEHIYVLMLCSQN